MFLCSFKTCQQGSPILYLIHRRVNKSHFSEKSRRNQSSFLCGF